MSTFYAVFEHPEKARLAVMALVNEGVPTDDISLVAHGSAAAFGHSPGFDENATKPLSDATSFVGAPDDPLQDSLTPRGSISEDKYDVTESPVGGGISTSTSDDAIDSVDQSDDSQSLAEVESRPNSLISQADQEVHDLDLAAETGFPNKPQGFEGFPKSSVPAIDEIDEALEVLDVPGFGVVVGSGPLATAVLDFADGDSTDDIPEMMKYFSEEGVPDSQAQEYLKSLDQGQALLAVGLIPGEVDPPLLESVASRFNAISFNTYDAPRY